MVVRALTGHDVIMEALAHPGVRKEARHWRAWAQGEIPMDWPLISWVAPDNMLTADGDRHRRLRTLVSQAFTPRRVEELRPRITEITAELLDGLAAAGPGPVDLKAALSLPLPMTVISELFGVGAEHRGTLHTLMHRVFDATTTPEVAARTNADMQAFLAELAERKSREPGDDLTSALLQARAEGDERLSHTELVWTLILMIGAGYETTMNLITNAVHALLTHRDQLELVRSGGASWADAVEETLRWDASIQYLPLRYTAEDVTLAGTRVPAGEALLMGFGAAGRDPGRHGEDAHAFDLRREQRGHLAFSHGPHFCLGAGLARLEGVTALEALFTRFPDLRLAEGAEVEQAPSIVASGRAALPVVWG
ncbi:MULTISPECIES: cytochrome P450 family protein [Nocardiopsis]|uniref:cytochrome P450 family protein n=1 Tax=Nocardiopsis TaxID=2013 RepID=UPI0008FCD170|nr:cytochrome P450 [Nocardiopsis dassonvillei]APC37936.1 cytochrome [Nocardiopsis dassonvillei]